jgi:catecholate siderophore receptor
MSRSIARHVTAAILILRCTSQLAAATGGSLTSGPSHSEQTAEATSIAGTVVDATGAEVRAALVTLEAADGGQWHTSTDATGHFVFTRVADGPMRLIVTLRNFEPVTLDVAEARTNLQIVLHPAAVFEQVTVLATAPTGSVIATASKTDTPLRDLPQAVTVVNADVIADHAMHGMADLARYVPGLGMAQGEGHRDAPIFRGQASTADFFVDGIRDDAQYVRDLYNVERVEILKGPNGMVFGRGGVGGVINRVTRQADWAPAREVAAELGSAGGRRATMDLGHAPSRRVGIRATGLYEDSRTYRDGVEVERAGINPTAVLALGASTMLRVGYELFHDDRTVDRGVPSFLGLPVDVDPSTFFGNAAASRADVTVHNLSSLVEHQSSKAFKLRQRVSLVSYDKAYQNVFAGAVNSTGTTVSLSGYRSTTERQNVFSQTDVIRSLRTGRLAHDLLVGAELGRQATDNLRLTAYFLSGGQPTTSITVPLSDPTTSQPFELRPSATDANNHGVATTAAAYLQDQIAVTDEVLATLGVRYDYFSVVLTDQRTATDLTSTDGLVSPRVGLVYKPVPLVSVYSSYTLSYLPRAGEQLASLSVTNQALEPETFRNYELGVKWDLGASRSLTTALYRLNRGNAAVPDPVNPAILYLVDAQRHTGLEVEFAGQLEEHWTVTAGYAYQEGRITRSLSATALAGARTAQLPAHSLSLWNNLTLTRAWSLGVGAIARSDSFVATDNLVTLPGFVRVDSALFYSPTSRIRLQLNVENLLNQAYFPTAHNNNNIMPGSPRTASLTFVTKF